MLNKGVGACCFASEKSEWEFLHNGVTKRVQCKRYHPPHDLMMEADYGRQQTKKYKSIGLTPYLCDEGSCGKFCENLEHHVKRIVKAKIGNRQLFSQ